jgi:hypothetical protein
VRPRPRIRNPAIAAAALLVALLALGCGGSKPAAHGSTHPATTPARGSAVWPAILLGMKSRCGAKIGTPQEKECVSFSKQACETAPEQTSGEIDESERTVHNDGCAVVKANDEVAAERAAGFTADGGPPGAREHARPAWSKLTCTQFDAHATQWYEQAAKVFAYYDAVRSNGVPESTLQMAYTPALERACASKPGGYSPGPAVIGAVEARYGIG